MTGPSLTAPAAASAEPGSAALSDALAAIGDQWSLRVLRAILTGTRRFGQLRDALDASDPVLSKRLRTLTEAGLLTRREYQQNPPRYEYRLAPMGRDLWLMFAAMWVWDHQWSADITSRGNGEVLHEVCGRTVVPVFGCAQCGAIGVTPRDTMATVDRALALRSMDRRIGRVVRTNSPLGHTAISLLGDTWATALLAGAMLGVRRFGDFQARLPGTSPVTLADRLSQLVDVGMLDRQPVVAGGRRMEYRLTGKGREYFPIFCTLNAWAQRYFAPDGTSGLEIVHRFCDSRLQPRYTCNGCNQELRMRDLDLVDV